MDAFTIGSWPVDSRVTLTRVAWDQQYRDVVRFEDEEERDTYFSSLDGDSIYIERMTYLRFSEPIRINVPFSSCYNYNYLIVENPKLPVPGESEPPKLFYFITGVAMIAPNTSALTLQLDVFQTYLFDFELGYSFLDRGHWPMARFNELVIYDDDKPRFSWSDARQYLTAPEGLDIGNEYMINWSNHYDLTYGKFDESGKYVENSGGWAILVMSTTNLQTAWGSEGAPSLDTSPSTMVDGLVSGCEVLIFWNVGTYISFAQDASEHPWVSAGILCITAVPKLMLLDAYENGDLAKAGYNGDQYDDVFTNVKTKDALVFNNKYDFKNAFYNSFPAKCRHFFKLYTFPYCVIEISALNGCSLLLKPELMNTDEIELRSVSCGTPGNIRLALYPAKYGARANFDDTTVKYQDLEGVQEREYTHDYSLDCALWFDNFPQFSIVNDNYLMYLASTLHTREYQYQAAGWAVDKTNMGIQAGREAMYTGMNAQLANQRITNIAGAANTGLNLVGSAVQGASSGGYAGAAAGLIGGAFSAAGTGISLYAQNLQLENTLKAQGDIYDINAQLAQNIAQGDYEMAIAGIDATVQDAALTQPSQVGANGGNGFNIANGYFGYDIRYKAPNTRYINILCNYWGRYGYAYHQYMQPPKNLKCMRYFTYWKMKDTYLTCTKADEGAKDVLRGIFERGVTVWNDPQDIGAIDPLDNWEVL